MRMWTIVGAAVLLALPGCSKDDPVSPPVPPALGLGTPLTAADALEAQTRLLWSGATGEIVAVASFNDPNTNALIAVHSTTGARRTLDARASAPLVLSPDGASVYYLTLDIDSTVARSVALTGAAPTRRLAACDQGGCVHLVAPSPDPDVVAIRSNSADSLELLTLSTGERDTVTDGYPLIFSPDGAELLKKEFFDPIQDAVIFDLATGTTRAAGLGLPADIGAYRLRWDDFIGLQVLYVTADRKSLVLRHAEHGIDVPVFSTADTLEPLMDWTGSRVAIWTSKAAGAGRSYDLVVIHGQSAIGGINRVARTTSPPGSVAQPPNGANEVVYAVDRRLYRSTYTPPMEGAPPIAARARR